MALSRVHNLHQGLTAAFVHTHRHQSPKCTWFFKNQDPWLNPWKKNEKCQTIAMFFSELKEFVKCHVLHAFLSLTCANATCCFVSRTCVEPPHVTLSAWLMLAPCATPRGAAPWSKTTAYLQPSPLLMSLVSPTNTTLQPICIVTVVCLVMWVHINRLKYPCIHEVHLPSHSLSTGHVFNMPHDNVKACEDVFGKLQDNHMMSPTLIQINRTSPWSPCSAAIITEFLDSGHGEFPATSDRCVWLQTEL